MGKETRNGRKERRLKENELERKPGKKKLETRKLMKYRKGKGRTSKKQRKEGLWREGKKEMNWEEKKMRGMKNGARADMMNEERVE